MLELCSLLFLLPFVGRVAALPFKDISIPYAYSSQYSSLIRSRGVKQPSSKALALSIGITELYSEEYDNAFITNLTVGGQELLVVVDTGSSDTWVADSNYTCVNITTNATVSQATCGLVATFNLTSAFSEIPNENFNISYGDGEYLNGVFGYETVELAGIEVSHQQIGVPYLAGWEGDNITSGLMGLAYPSLTAAYAGTNASADNASDPENYSPIINTIFFVENLTEPVFSLSLSRNPNMFGFGGYLTIGGIPNISDPSVNASDYFAVTPIEFLTVPRPVDFFTFYLIDVDEIVYPGSPGPNVTQFIVDSGTTVDYFPTADADAINALFDPPANYSAEYGLYVVPCNATPPEVGITIAGETFYHNPVDLFQNLGLGTELCGTAIMDGGDLLILGDTFLKNVLAVFDVGNSQMAFSSRMYYESESSD